jgi:hypothetical protein
MPMRFMDQYIEYLDSKKGKKALTLPKNGIRSYDNMLADNDFSRLSNGVELDVDAFPGLKAIYDNFLKAVQSGGGALDQWRQDAREFIRAEMFNQNGVIVPALYQRLNIKKDESGMGLLDAGIEKYGYASVAKKLESDMVVNVVVGRSKLKLGVDPKAQKQIFDRFVEDYQAIFQGIQSSPEKAEEIQEKSCFSKPAAGGYEMFLNGCLDSAKDMNDYRSSQFYIQSDELTFEKTKKTKKNISTKVFENEVAPFSANLSHEAFDIDNNNTCEKPTQAKKTKESSLLNSTAWMQTSKRGVFKPRSAETKAIDAEIALYNSDNISDSEKKLVLERIIKVAEVYIDKKRSSGAKIPADSRFYDVKKLWEDAVLELPGYFEKKFKACLNEIDDFRFRESTKTGKDIIEMISKIDKVRFLPGINPQAFERLSLERNEISEKLMSANQRFEICANEIAKFNSLADKTSKAYEMMLSKIDKVIVLTDIDEDKYKLLREMRDDFSAQYDVLNKEEQKNDPDGKQSRMTTPVPPPNEEQKAEESKQTEAVQEQHRQSGMSLGTHGHTTLSGENRAQGLNVANPSATSSNNPPKRRNSI